jgi:hypothetical protein
MSQDVERWVRELRAAGWEAIAFRRGGSVAVEGVTTTWRSPNGLLYRGPYKAWTIMNDMAYERSNDAD